MGEIADYYNQDYAFTQGQLDARRAALRDRGWWVSADGTQRLITTLSNAHLVNIIGHILAKRHTSGQARKLGRLVDEALSRDLPVPHILGL